MNVQNGLVVDVAGNRDAEGQNVQVWHRHNGVNQQWRIAYVDQTKGGFGLDPNYGLFINRPFYFISALKGKRVAEVDSAGMLQISEMKRGKKSQIFKLDGKSKTIVSTQWTDKSLNINHDGKSPDIQLKPTNGGKWW